MGDTIIIGIDCATDDAKVGLSLAVAEPANCVMRFAGVCSSERQAAEEVAAWLSGPTRGLLAFDAPLGWPRPLGKALVAHRAGEQLTVAANDLFRRATDRFIKARLGKQSLDVGADRIARTARSALKLLANVRQKTGLPIPLAWEPDYPEQVAAIEVYPAATLVAHGISATGYKRKEKIAERKAIMSTLIQLIQLPGDIAAMEQNADALDAAVCVLAGFDFLRGEAYKPDDIELARHEGWIWARTKSTTSLRCGNCQ
jgi:predicted RNase H-like nuclease